MDTVTGVVSAVKRDGKAICVDDNWYSSWDAISGVNKGDSVVFNYIKKGQYNNIKGKVRVENSGVGSNSPARPAYSNLGVEMGHASNLAMRMIEQYIDSGNELEVNSPAYWKLFMEYTTNMYEVMKRLKASKEEAQQSVKPTPSKSEVSDDEDIFG